MAWIVAEKPFTYFNAGLVQLEWRAVEDPVPILDGGWRVTERATGSERSEQFRLKDDLNGRPSSSIGRRDKAPGDGARQNGVCSSPFGRR